MPGSQHVPRAQALQKSGKFQGELELKLFGRDFR
jgi:hypothetical protein